MRIRSWSFFLLLLCPQAFAVPEADFRNVFQREVVPFYEAGHPGFVRGENGVRLAYRSFIHPKARGAIVVANGYSENLHKYAEVAFDLYALGYSVFLFDHRGQGYSDHLLKDSHKAHTDDFENYVKDLQTIFQQVVKPRAQPPRFLIAHSMGGAIAARFLEEHPEGFQKVVLIAPMLGLTFPKWLESPLCSFLNLLSWLSIDTFFIRPPRDPASYTFATTEVTYSQARYETLNYTITAHEPEVHVWGLTARWLGQALNSGHRIENDATRIQTPILLLQAGKDSFVRADAQDQFCRLAGNCRLIRIPGALHEILMETDQIRTPAIKEIADFLR